MEHKAKRQVLIKTEEAKNYDYAQKHKYDMQKRLDEIGYRSPEEYADYVSQLAW